MDAVIGGGLGAALTAAVSWLLSRRRERSDIAHLDADTEHTKVETIDMSLQMYQKLFADHRELMSNYRKLSLRIIRIEKWAVANGLDLPNGKHDG